NAHAMAVGEQAFLRLAAPPPADDQMTAPGLGKSQVKAERIDWLMSGIYCTCGMHDECAGHIYTLGACNPGPTEPCGVAQATRAQLSSWIDEGRTDRQIFDALLKERGRNLLRPHMKP